MSRKKKRIQRDMIEDSKYSSLLVSNIINLVMLKGKKNTSRTLIYKALDIIKNKIKDEPLKILTKAVDNVKPVLEVKPRRIGGATYQVPIEVDAERGKSLALRWIITFSRSRKGKSFAEKLASELMDAYKNEGSSIKKKEDTHKMAEANKAFAHYRW